MPLTAILTVLKRAQVIQVFPICYENSFEEMNNLLGKHQNVYKAVRREV